MTAALDRTAQQNAVLVPVAGVDFTREQIDLLKATVAVGTTDLELKFFLEVCRATGLNPFQKQIYAIKRGKDAKAKLTIQTGIDGYRAIAARTGTHLGTSDAEYGPADSQGFPEWARVVVYRLVQGHRAEFPATARWREYVQAEPIWDNGRKSGEKVSEMWRRMPHTMLAKCAEALALRRAFPAELSGVYSDVEMMQADSDTLTPVQVVTTPTATTMPARDTQTQQATSAEKETERLLREAAGKIGELAAPLRQAGHGKEVDEILAQHDWRGNLEKAREAYKALRALGNQLKNQPQSASPDGQPAVDVTHVELVSSAMVSKINAQLRRFDFPGGPNESPEEREKRLSFVAWLAKRTAPLESTKDLTVPEATKVNDKLSHCGDPSELVSQWWDDRTQTSAVDTSAKARPIPGLENGVQQIGAERFEDVPSLSG